MKCFEKYGYEIIATVTVITVLIVFVVPFCIGIGRAMWQWAIS